MSVAFTKEDSAETASETLLPDRPVSPHPNLVTEAGLKALEFQLQLAREAYETLIEGFSHFVTSMTAPIASGWSGCRVGLAPTGKRRLCTAHARSGHSDAQRREPARGLNLERKVEKTAGGSTRPRMDLPHQRWELDRGQQRPSETEFVAVGVN